MDNVSVVIPIGPDPVYLEYLPECIQSVLDQRYHGTIEIVLIEDAQKRLNIQDYVPTPIRFDRKAGLYGETEYYFVKENASGYGKVWFAKYSTPWNVGVPDAFNFGIALASNNLVFTMGSDDKMLPGCIAECVKEYHRSGIEGWYNVTTVTESGEESWIPNNTAMVTKKLWEFTGGFPPSAGVGACDALLLSILMVHAPERIIQVKQGTPLCWLREGEHQDTRKNMMYYAKSGVIEQIRNMETLRWKPKMPAAV